MSLFVGGAFLMLASNASRIIDEWKQEAKVVVYLVPGRTVTEGDALSELAARPDWVQGVEAVSAEEGRRRFRDSFPAVAGLVEGWEEEPLPATLEIAFDPLLVDEVQFEAWSRDLEGREEVDLVDDDRDWVAQLEVALRLVLSVGLTLGSVLLGAAILTIASVIRLTAMLYQDEIAVMRLIGATEFFIRGPFYMEGLFQGLLGGLVALGALFAGYGAMAPMGSETLVIGSVATSFLGAREQLLLVSLGAVAGLAGAVLSLRREVV